MFGYGPRSAAAQRVLEQRLAELVRGESVRALTRALAARPHVAGTPAQAATAEYVLAQLRSWGLAVETAEYEVYLPHPVEAVVERLTAPARALALREPVLAEVPESGDATQWPAWHGYAAAGDVRGPLVYVNYAREEDLDRLAELGVDLAGCIALARYGELFRGLKVQNVQRRGAVGCLLYTDPQDDGYFRGDPFPVGPMRPAGGLQRGSLNTRTGDPTAPGRVSRPGVARIPPAQSPALPRIPSLPLAAAEAAELSRDLRGPEVPQEWQGALPWRYHVGPGPVEVRLRVAHDGALRTIVNTFGRLPGRTDPDEWIVIGGHRDAWCCGAVDNVSGVASVLEAARVCAALAQAGSPPRRTLVFATWDAEEWGLIGSTEWVEEHATELGARVIAYLNQDIAVCGPEFGASASPSLAGVVRDVTRGVAEPGGRDGTSVYDAWRARAASGPPRRPGEGAGRSAAPAAAPDEPVVGMPGGGSDHEGFLLHLGVPAVGCGFYGRWGNYHSTYDTLHFLETQADPAAERQRAAATVTAALALRLANAPVAPLDYVEYARAVTAAAQAARAQAGAVEALAAVSFDELAAAVAAFATAADAATRQVAATDWDAAPEEAQRRLHAALRSIEPLLTRPADAAPDPLADPFHRNLVFGVNPLSGYAGWTLPGVTGAIARPDPERLARELGLLAQQLRRATARLTDTAGPAAPR